MKSRRQTLEALLALPLAALLPGCIGRAPAEPFEPAPSREAARKKLRDLSHAYEALMIRHGEAARRALTSGDASSAELEDVRAKEASLVREAERLLEYHEALLPPAETRSWQLGALGVSLLEDPETRALERRLHEAQHAKVEVGGESLGLDQVDEWLRASRPERRDAAAQALSELQRRSEPIAKELLLRRRARARELGEEYYEALLRVRRVQLTRLETLAQAFVSGTDLQSRYFAASLGRVMRLGLGRPRGSYAPHDLQLALDRITPLPAPWFPADRALEAALAVADDLGLASVGRLLGQLVVLDGAPGGEVARTRREVYCLEESMSVGQPITSKVVPLSTASDGFARWHAVMLELGRVTQLSLLGESEPVLKGYPWIPGFADPAFDLGFARIFSGLLADAPTLQRYGKLDARQSVRVAASLRTRTLFELRQRIAWMTFERRALANPKQDLSRLAGQINARLTGLNTPVFWAADRRLATCPGSEPAALMGQLFAFEILSWLRGETGSVGEPVKLDAQNGRRLVGALLRHGVSRSIDEKLIKLRSRRLSARAAVMQLTTQRSIPERPISL